MEDAELMRLLSQVEPRGRDVLRRLMRAEQLAVVPNREGPHAVLGARHRSKPGFPPFPNGGRIGPASRGWLVAPRVPGGCPASFDRWVSALPPG
jgi:hypothetical protein